MAAGDRLVDPEGEDLDAAVTGTVSRRGFLRRTVGFGLAAPVLLVALQACGDDDDEDEEENGGDEPSAEPTASSRSAAPSPGGASPAGRTPTPTPAADGADASPGGISVELGPAPTSAAPPAPPEIGG